MINGVYEFSDLMELCVDTIRNGDNDIDYMNIISSAEWHTRLHKGYTHGG